MEKIKTWHFSFVISMETIAFFGTSLSLQAFATSILPLSPITNMTELLSAHRGWGFDSVLDSRHGSVLQHWTHIFLYINKVESDSD